MHWYGIPGDGSLSAWEAFDVTDVVLAVAGLTALVIATVSLAGLSVSLPLAGSAVTGDLGIVAVALVLYRLLNPVGDGLEREAGIWIGLAASIGIFAGGFTAMRAGN